MAQLFTSNIWELNGGAPDMEAFASGPVYGGLDTPERDFTALVMLAERPAGIWNVWCHFWTPAKTLAERSARDRVPYDLWASQGHLTAVDSTDYDYLIAKLAVLSEQGNFRELMCDRFRFGYMQTTLQRHGVMNLPVTLCHWGYRDMTGAVDALEALALQQRLRHGMHPVLTMGASTATVVMNPAGNRKLAKAQRTSRIEGLVALAMAAKSATATTRGIGDSPAMVA